jgi:fumarate reductase flavoprotein subunit
MSLGKEDLNMRNQNNKTKAQTSRRQFLKGSLVTGVAGAVAASGMAPATAKADATPAAARSLHSWETPPETIPDSRIVKTVEADIVIVGAGCAGLNAAYGAARNGAKVVVIEKMKTFSARGNCNAALNSKLQRKKGYKIDPDEVVANLICFSGNRSNQELLKLWAYKSGEIFDNILDLCDKNGVEVTLLETFNPSKKYPYLYPGFPTAHIFAKPGAARSTGNEYVPTQIYLLELIEKYAKEAGAQFFYRTPARQLIKSADGRITGVIGESREVGLVRYIARKAVILASGGYTENKEMINAWCPAANDPEIGSYMPIGGNTGDGFNMGLWAGAALQKWPHPIMVHTIPGISIDQMTGNQSFMHVNRLGVRYENESLPNQALCDGRFRQPGKQAWAVFDAKYEKDHDSFKTGFDGPICESMAALEESVAKGLVLKANTIEELGKKMGVPVERFKQSVARYTEFARKGKDEEFDKDAFLLFTIEKAPFFAIPIKSHLLTTVGGLDCDSDMQVLDTKGNKIPGLYAAGNTMGNFFANEYPLLAPGLSHGRAIVLSQILGERLAKS